MQERVENRAGEQHPVYDRINTNHAAYEMVKERPLTGFGWDSFEQHSQPFIRQVDDIPLTGENLGVHNVFLAFAADLGLPGALLWSTAVIGALITAIVSNWRIPGRVMAAATLAIAAVWLSAAMLSPLSQAFPSLFLWTFIGFALAHARNADEEVGVSADRPELVGARR